MRSERDELLKQLADVINNKEEANITFNQVNYYIGCDMSNDNLRVWIEEAMEEEGVTAADVLELWDDNKSNEVTQ